MKKHKRHLFTLCASASCIAFAAVFIKAVDIVKTDIAIETAQADVRQMYKGGYNPVDAPTVSSLQTQHKAGRVLVITQVGN